MDSSFLNYTAVIFEFRAVSDIPVDINADKQNISLAVKQSVRILLSPDLSQGWLYIPFILQFDQKRRLVRNLWRWQIHYICKTFSSSFDWQYTCHVNQSNMGIVLHQIPEKAQIFCLSLFIFLPFPV
jgi:hypothetical protein